MDWQKPIDVYCERMSPDFWAEPLNALTNIAFLLSAILALRFANQHQTKTFGIYWLTFLATAIGLGSFLFHTFANVWSMLADVLPIYLFQISFVILYGAAIARHYSKPQWLGSLILLAIFIATNQAFSVFPAQSLNGSVMYIPTAIILFFLGWFHYQTYAFERSILLITVGVFILSLTARTLDNMLCDVIPLGTHIFWHLFNGMVIYLSIRAYIGVLLSESNQIRETTHE